MAKYFRGDIWHDKKVTARTRAALAKRHVKFPSGINIRKTAEFKEEYRRQTILFRKERLRMKEQRREQRRAQALADLAAKEARLPPPEEKP